MVYVRGAGVPQLVPGYCRNVRHASERGEVAVVRAWEPAAVAVHDRPPVELLVENVLQLPGRWSEREFDERG